MTAHWDSLCGRDFFAVETLGLTRGGSLQGIFGHCGQAARGGHRWHRHNSDGKWMEQVARNLADSVDGFLRNATYLIHDRAPLFTEAFEAILREREVRCVRIPAQS